MAVICFDHRHDKNGNTPLHLVCRHPDVSLVEMILKTAKTQMTREQYISYINSTARMPGSKTFDDPER